MTFDEQWPANPDAGWLASWFARQGDQPDPKTQGDVRRAYDNSRAKALREVFDSLQSPAAGDAWAPDICIYHADCMDGFGAAWAVWKRWGSDVIFLPGVYGAAPPDVHGKDVLIVDFSYKQAVLAQMGSGARSIVVLDHHKSAEAELQGFDHLVGASADDVERIRRRTGGAKILTDFDMERSGATMAWSFCHPGKPVPLLLRYIEDRDLWRWQLPHSREVNAALSSYPKEFAVFDGLGHAVADGRYGRIDVDADNGLVREGRAILRVQDAQIRDLLAASTRRAKIAGYDVPVANVPFMWASDAGNILAQGEPFAVTWYETSAGTRGYSLRSAPDGIDVSEIARLFGGGGHEHAAGFAAQAGVAW